MKVSKLALGGGEGEEKPSVKEEIKFLYVLMRKSCFLTVSLHKIIALCTDCRFLPDYSILSVKGKLRVKRNERSGKAPDWSLCSICCLSSSESSTCCKKKGKKKKAVTGCCVA